MPGCPTLIAVSESGTFMSESATFDGSGDYSSTLVAAMSPAELPSSYTLGERDASTTKQLKNIIEIKPANVQTGTVTVLKRAVVLPLELEQGVPDYSSDNFHQGFSSTFAFRRRGGSLSWNMGLNLVFGDWNREIASLYTRFSDIDATLVLLSTTLGPASYVYSASVAKSLGVAFAIILTVLVAISYLYLSIRLVDVPKLLCENVDTCHDMVKTLFHPFFYALSCCFIFLRIFIACGVLYFHVVKAMVNLFPAPSHSYIMMPMRIVCFLFLAYASALWCSPRIIRISAKCSLYSMVIGSCIVGACLVWITYFPPRFADPDDNCRLHEDQPCTMVSTTPQPYASSSYVNTPNYVFGALSYVPHVIGDMQNPTHAGKVLRCSMFLQILFYSVIAILGYSCLGFTGDTLRNLWWRVVDSKPLHSQVVGRAAIAIMRILYVVKTLTTYIVIIWPLSREVHRIVGMDNSPALTLGLPWAARRNQRFKLLLRFSLVLASTMFFTVGWSLAEKISGSNPKIARVRWYLFLILPHVAVEYIIIPFCIIVALVRTRRTLTQRSPEQMKALLTIANPKVFGSDKDFGWQVNHFGLAVLLLFCSVSMFAVMVSIDYYHFLVSAYIHS